MEEPVELQCSYCKKNFFRAAREARRSAKINRGIFCSLSCHCSLGNKKHLRGNVANLVTKVHDEYSQFRRFLTTARAHRKSAGKSLPEISVEYLKKVWENQQGICPYTRIQMYLTDVHIKKLSPLPTTPSLDRIDSSNGYVEGNVEFVCLAINYAKNGWSKEEISKFVSTIRSL